MDAQQPVAGATRMPDVARVPLGRINEVTNGAILKRVLGARPVPVATFQSAI